MKSYILSSRTLLNQVLCEFNLVLKSFHEGMVLYCNLKTLEWQSNVLEKYISFAEKYLAKLGVNWLAQHISVLHIDFPHPVKL